METTAEDFTNSTRPWQPVPDWYISNGTDIRDAIDAFNLPFNLGMIAKYIFRAGRKPGNSTLLDLKKAREHIDREIKRLEARAAKTEVL